MSDELYVDEDGNLYSLSHRIELEVGTVTIQREPFVSLSERIAGAIFDELVDRQQRGVTLPGTQDELRLIAEAALNRDLSANAVANALTWVRERALENGWTIPYVQSGSAKERVYMVVAADPSMGGIGAKEAEAVEAGFNVRVQAAITSLRRATSQVELVALHVRSRTARKALRMVIASANGAVTLLEELLMEEPA